MYMHDKKATYCDKHVSSQKCIFFVVITHEFSAPYTPQQNGVVECKNRTLIEMARTMLDEYNTPRKFCPEAIDTACHIINRSYLHKFFK